MNLSYNLVPRDGLLTINSPLMEKQFIMYHSIFCQILNCALFWYFQALARLRFSEYVAQSDVDEALRLMQMSKFSLYSDDRQKSGLDAISDIYSILRDEAARSNKMDVSYAHALNWISRKVCF